MKLACSCWRVPVDAEWGGSRVVCNCCLVPSSFVQALPTTPCAGERSVAPKCKAVVVPAWEFSVFYRKTQGFEERFAMILQGAVAWRSVSDGPSNREGIRPQ
jgi:hypothetical protein